MSGLYAANGSVNVSVVSGSSYTGLYAADGSWNAVKSAGGTFIGLYHACGALNVTVAPAATVISRFAPDGSLYVYTGAYTGMGQQVTVVSGSLSSYTPTYYMYGF